MTVAQVMKIAQNALLKAPSGPETSSLMRGKRAIRTWVSNLRGGWDLSRLFWVGSLGQLRAASRGSESRAICRETDFRRAVSSSLKKEAPINFIFGSRMTWPNTLPIRKSSRPWPSKSTDPFPPPSLLRPKNTIIS